MGPHSEYSYYYQCVPESFVFDTDAECVSIKHHGDEFEIRFYEISEVRIDFDEKDDYVLEIRCWNEHSMFQFVNKKDALKVCIELFNQIVLLPERRGTLMNL